VSAALSSRLRELSEQASIMAQDLLSAPSLHSDLLRVSNDLRKIASAVDHPSNYVYHAHADSAGLTVVR